VKLTASPSRKGSRRSWIRTFYLSPGAGGAGQEGDQEAKNLRGGTAVTRPAGLCRSGAVDQDREDEPQAHHLAQAAGPRGRFRCTSGAARASARARPRFAEKLPRESTSLIGQRKKLDAALWLLPLATRRHITWAGKDFYPPFARVRGRAGGIGARRGHSAHHERQVELSKIRVDGGKPQGQKGGADGSTNPTEPRALLGRPGPAPRK